MDPNRGNDRNDPQKPNKPKGNYMTALMIALVLVLLFSWISNTIKSSQYNQTTYSDFVAARDAGQLAEVEIQSDRRRPPNPPPSKRPASPAFPAAPTPGPWPRSW